MEELKGWLSVLLFIALILIIVHSAFGILLCIQEYKRKKLYGGSIQERIKALKEIYCDDIEQGPPEVSKTAKKVANTATKKKSTKD